MNYSKAHQNSQDQSLSTVERDQQYRDLQGKEARVFQSDFSPEAIGLDEWRCLGCGALTALLLERSPKWKRFSLGSFYRDRCLSDCLEILEQQGFSGNAAIFLLAFGGGKL